MAIRELFCQSLLSFCVVALSVIVFVEGHGRLIEPPSRVTAWRYGFNTPKEYTDNEWNCGGFANQWNTNGGKCGLCGDPYQGPRESEAGGKFATEVIVRRFWEGQTINITVELTSAHKGWYEFKLCKNDNPRKNFTQECLDENALKVVPRRAAPNTPSVHRLEGYADSPGKVDMVVTLPVGLTCTQCVLQWKYHAGNSWGKDAETGDEGMGYGPQEEFYACADIEIVARSSTTTRSTIANTQSTSRVTTTQSTTMSTGSTSTSGSPTISSTTSSTSSTSATSSTVAPSSTASPSAAASSTKSTNEGPTCEYLGQYLENKSDRNIFYHCAYASGEPNLTFQPVEKNCGHGLFFCKTGGVLACQWPESCDEQ